jgi:hypothetical protein
MTKDLLVLEVLHGWPHRIVSMNLEAYDTSPN